MREEGKSSQLATLDEILLARVSGLALVESERGRAASWPPWTKFTEVGERLGTC